MNMMLCRKIINRAQKAVPALHHFNPITGSALLYRSSHNIQNKYVHGHDAAVLRSHRWRTVENSASFIKPYLRGGARVLDCGCGPGSLTNDIARYCGPENVIGVDQSDSVLATATASFPGIKFLRHDVMKLPFEDGMFDVVFAHQVIQYLSDATGGLSEMKRVCKPGGIVAVREGDADGFLWMPQHVGFEKFRKGYKGAVRCMGGDASIAGKLPMLAHRVGFEKVDVSASNWCFSKREEREWWGSLWLERVQGGQLAKTWDTYGVMNREDIEEMKEGIQMYIDREDGLFVLTHVEVVGHKEQ